MRLAWLTDVHLNFVPFSAVTRLIEEILAESPDAVLIGGDIGEANDVCLYLKQLAEQLRLPIYFVLGNHDYYRGSVAGVRSKVIELAPLLRMQGSW
jgi:predicted MPP superfamily phosphohydrolase